MSLPAQFDAPQDGTDQTALPTFERALWARLESEATASAREAVFAHYLPYARAVAAQLYAGRDDVEFKDFLQLACIGLLESIDRFEPERGVKFETFCTPRIKGSVLAGITRLSDGQEQVSLQRRLRCERLTSLELEPEPEPESRGRPDDAFHTLASIAVGLAIGFLLDDTGLVEAQTAIPTPYGNAYQTIAWRQTRERLHSAVDRLAQRDQKIIRYHYFHGLGFEQIADILGLTKGRISQLHRAALLELRTHIGETQHLFNVS
jgi:RNA polymerase sigma factor for flagellar operon FliA